MPAHDALFFGILFFIFGIYLASLGFGSSAIFFVPSAAFLFLLIFILKKNVKYIYLSVLLIFIFFGVFYFGSRDGTHNKIFADYGKRSLFEATITKVLSSNDKTISFAAEMKNKEKILMRMPKYPEFSYGDTLSFQGAIYDVGDNSYSKYLLKEGISGIVNFPEIVDTDKSYGGFKHDLIKFKDRIINFFDGTLPEKESSFLSGLILGEKEGFSEEFKEAMKKSGTTHLVALSGYNVSLLVMGTLFIFSFFLPRLLSLFLALVLVIIFVTMTGGESSVVRAAIIGFLMFAAGESGRLFDPRNVIMIAALIMLLINPRLLVFDIGFELSFLAFLGIVYLKPIIAGESKFFAEPGFMNWRDNLNSTFSAQIMVLPIIWGNFGYVSPVSLPANALIAGLIPVTMALGFGAASLGLLSHHLGILGSWVVFPFLKLETFMVELFGNIDLGFSVNFGLVASVVYYSAVLYFIAWKRKKCLKNF